MIAHSLTRFYSSYSSGKDAPSSLSPSSRLLLLRDVIDNIPWCNKYCNFVIVPPLYRAVGHGAVHHADPSLYSRKWIWFARLVTDTLPYHSDSQLNFHICIYQSGSSHNSAGCYLRLKVRHDPSSISHRLCYSCTSFIRPRLRLGARETMRTLSLYRTRNQR